MTSLWFGYALLTAVVYAGIALLSKVVSGTEIDDPIALTVYSCVPFYAVYVVGGAALEWPALTGGDRGVTSVLWSAPTATALAIGVVSTVAYGVYYWGLVNGDVSRFVPALALETIFVLVLGYLLLGEAFPPGVYAGVGLVVFGALFIAYERGDGALLERLGLPTVAVAMAAAVAFAALNTGMKALTDSFGTVELLFWISLGGLLSVVAIAPFRIRTGDASVGPPSLRQLTSGERLLIVGGLLNAVALFTFLRALEHGPVSLATAITKLDVLLVFVGALTLSKLAPALLTEQFDPFTLAQKASASVIILAGCVLIQFSY
ncbi:EamA family transporter [Natronolimnohabitans innermongolicus]|uniref:Integral membrane protein n=1 Tax=Natronolimnohabitans innermongolicus JCM 12255 TaxID=1227499 RepID=L9WPL3_9EURY|nr:EamA family transporter [Natronolimnohabitans innermongolicus]ELY51141.1 integral membrane protein [Natronolimnohabitans innermongolicus JCM 12255]